MNPRYICYTRSVVLTTLFYIKWLLSPWGGLDWKGINLTHCSLNRINSFFIKEEIPNTGHWVSKIYVICTGHYKQNYRLHHYVLGHINWWHWNLLFDWLQFTLFQIGCFLLKIVALYIDQDTPVPTFLLG